MKTSLKQSYFLSLLGELPEGRVCVQIPDVEIPLIVTHHTLSLDMFCCVFGSNIFYGVPIPKR